jgi:hypothetical protein
MRVRARCIRWPLVRGSIAHDARAREAAAAAAAKEADGNYTRFCAA